MDPKRLPKARRWAKCMARCLSFNISPNQIIRLILQGKIVQNNQKKGFCAVFGHFGAPPNGPKKIHKVPQLSGMSRPMSELKNKPLTRSLGLFFLGVQNNQKRAFSTVFGYFWLKWVTIVANKAVIWGHECKEHHGWYNRMIRHHLSTHIIHTYMGWEIKKT